MPVTLRGQKVEGYSVLSTCRSRRSSRKLEKVIKCYDLERV